MSLLRIYLFGGLAISWGDHPLPSIPGLVSRSLFAYLVTYRERPHTCDLLAGTFWPDLRDDLARRRFSQALWQIGRALSPHTILLAHRETVQLNPDLPLFPHPGFKFLSWTPKSGIISGENASTSQGTLPGGGVCQTIDPAKSAT